MPIFQSGFMGWRIVLVATGFYKLFRALIACLIISGCANLKNQPTYSEIGGLKENDGLLMARFKGFGSGTTIRLLPQLCKTYCSQLINLNVSESTIIVTTIPAGRYEFLEYLTVQSYAPVSQPYHTHKVKGMFDPIEIKAGAINYIGDIHDVFSMVGKKPKTEIKVFDNEEEVIGVVRGVYKNTFLKYPFRKSLLLKLKD